MVPAILSVKSKVEEVLVGELNERMGYELYNKVIIVGFFTGSFCKSLDPSSLFAKLSALTFFS